MTNSVNLQRFLLKKETMYFMKKARCDGTYKIVMKFFEVRSFEENRKVFDKQVTISKPDVIVIVHVGLWDSTQFVTIKGVHGQNIILVKPQVFQSSKPSSAFSILFN